MRSRLLAALLLGCLAGVVAPAPASADEGDPAGWSVRTDPRRRAFLVATETAGGPRLLTVACLRDVDTFAIYTGALPGLAERTGPADVVLSVADAEFTLTGTIEAEGFSGERDLDTAGRKALARDLRRVLDAPGPVVVTVGDAPAIEIPLEPLPPRAGIAGPLATFAKICFGP